MNTLNDAEVLDRMSETEKTLRVRLRTDLEVYARACLKIRTKEGSIGPLIFNRSQRYLHERLEKQLKEKGRVRALVLKGRQVGTSTYITARFYWKCSHRTGFRTFILAHLDLASDNLFSLIKRYHEHVPEPFRPHVGASNAKELSFDILDGGVKVATAASRSGVGRSETIQLLLGSEFAFWPDADSHFRGVMQAIADKPETECILESTANGLNAFHKLWIASERGESDFEPIFVPYHWHLDYTTEAPKDWTPPGAFVEYGEVHELSPGQIRWAFLKNRELALASGDSSEELCWQFRSEFPATSQEAFQTGSSGSFISSEKVVRARKGKTQAYGPIILGVDPARHGGDRTAIVDRQGRVIGGHVCKTVDFDDLMQVAHEVQQEVNRIKPTKVVVDITGLGAGLVDRLKELLGDLVEGVNFGSKAYDFKRYSNRRAEMWGTLGEWFNDSSGVSIPDKDELHTDLCAPTAPGTVVGGTRFNSNGQLVLEPKDKIKARIGQSPDLADACALTFAVDMSRKKEINWDLPPPPPGGFWST